MNKGMIKIWTLLAVLMTASGCASNSSNNDILSAADADRMVTVTVTPAKTESLVASLNQEVE